MSHAQIKEMSYAQIKEMKTEDMRDAILNVFSKHMDDKIRPNEKFALDIGVYFDEEILGFMDKQDLIEMASYFLSATSMFAFTEVPGECYIEFLKSADRKMLCVVLARLDETGYFK